MSEKNKELIDKIRDSLVKPPSFISEHSKIDQHFALFYKHLKTLEDEYETALIDSVYLLDSICKPIDELIEFLNEEFKDTDEDSKTLPLSLNDMRLVDQYIKFITLQLLYRFLPTSVKPQNYLLTTDQKGIYGNFNRLKRIKDTELLKLIVDRLIITFFNDSHTKGNSIIQSCVKLSNFNYDLIISVIYLISHSSDPGAYNDQWTCLEMSAIDTYDIYVNYSIWINYLGSVPLMQKLLSTRLSNLLVLNKSGLKSLIEFILQTRETEEIELTKITQVAEIVIKKPPCCKTNKSYFANLFDQIFLLLELENNSNIIIAIMNILSILFTKNPKIINDFFNKRLISDYLMTAKEKFADNTVPFHDLIKKMNVILTLTKQNDYNFIQNLVEYYNEYDFIFLIYRYINFVYVNWKQNTLNADIINESYVNSLINCLKFFLLCSNGKWYLINYLIVNYDFNSQNDRFGKLIVNADKTFELSFISEVSKNLENEQKISKIQNLQRFIQLQDLQNDLIIKVLETLMKNDTILTNVFVTILRRWCESYNSEEVSDAFLQLNDLRIMNRILELESFRNEVSQNSNNVLVVISDLLSLPSKLHTIAPESDSDEDEDDENDNPGEHASQDETNVLQMLLKLLSLILTSCEDFSKTQKEELNNIRTKLASNYKNNKAAISLISRITKVLTNSSSNNIEDEEDNDVLATEKKELQQALANLNDPLPPIKAQGLYELRELILKKSKVIDYGVVLELHLLEIKNKEPFVYLNSIKGLVVMCEDDQSLQYLMKLYEEYDNKESSLAITLEEELRIGEVLSQFFQAKKYLINNCENLHRMFSITLGKVNASNVNKLDNRIRMSAMSILGILIQLNMELLTDSELIDCFNCIKGVLTFEFDEKNDSFKLLRRSSIYLLHDMVYNSGLDRFVISFKEYQSLIDLLKYNRDVKEKDDLAVELIKKLLDLIDEIWKETYTVSEDPNDTLLSKLKILE